MDYLVNFTVDEHGNPSKYPHGWFGVDAETATDALVAGLKSEHNHFSRPAIGWVSLGKFRHEDGSPCAVQKFKMEWEGK